MAAIKDIHIESDSHLPALDFNVAQPGEFQFLINDSIQCKVEGIEFGITTEQCAQIKKIREHRYMDLEGFWVDYKSTIPFGSEPHISRKLECTNNYCKVSTALSLNTGFPFNELNIDKLTLKADWQEMNIIVIDSNQNFEEKKLDLTTLDQQVIFSSTSTIITSILKTKDGNSIEIGQGDDLWRWNIAEQFNTQAEFSFHKSGDCITFTRKPIIWQEETELKRDWRFKWYIAWNYPCQTVDTNDAITLPTDLSNFKYEGINIFKLPETWQPNAAVQKASGKQTPPCFHASIVKRYLKTFIRNIKDKLDGQTIYICNIAPNICLNASHLERPKKKHLLHWDLLDILEFQFWANKQLLANNSNLILLPSSKSALGKAPSLNFIN